MGRTSALVLCLPAPQRKRLHFHISDISLFEKIERKKAPQNWLCESDEDDCVTELVVADSLHYGQIGSRILMAERAVLNLASVDASQQQICCLTVITPGRESNCRRHGY